MSENPHISRNPRAAFSLVELLVVIAIIAILVALLLPTISLSQQAAQQIQCAAQLNQIVTMVHNHANAHQGYAPLVGLLNTISLQPDAFDDDSMTKYSYVSFNVFGEDNVLEAFSASLASELGDQRIDYAMSIEDLNDANSDPRGYLKIFRCPANMFDPGPVHEFTTYCLDPASANIGINPPLPIIEWLDSQSYIYNEAALGWNDSMARSRGNLSRIHKQSQTMLMADGVGGDYTRYYCNFTTVYNKTPTPPITLADALAGNANAGDPANFDLPRHRGHINIAFFDSHVETRSINVNDLSNVYLLAP
jgi:prepilin-type N-terminal cleavage/methylation domain-containing protein/prepilin-type processing-associated H-X9-DG protein